MCLVKQSMKQFVQSKTTPAFAAGEVPAASHTQPDAEDSPGMRLVVYLTLDEDIVAILETPTLMK